MKEKLRSNGAAGKPPKVPVVLPGVAMPVATRRRLSTREIVAATNLSPQRVQQRLKRGESGPEIVAAVRARKASEAAALADEHEHRSRTGGTAPAPLSFSTRKRAEADAELKALELATKRGELLPTWAVTLAMSGCIIRAREIWMAIPDLVPAIRQCADPIAAQQMVDTEIRRGLLELEKFGVKLAHRIAGSGGEGATDGSAGTGGNGGDDE